MAVRRFDSGAGDFITCAIGAAGTFNEGAFTVVALVKKEADGGFFPMVSGETDSNSRRSFWTIDTNVLMSNTGGFNINTPVSFTQADDWAVVAITKPAGTVLTRGHKGVIGGAWTHTDGDQGFDDSPGSQVLTHFKLGSWQGISFWHGLVAAVAVWAGTALSDAELEDGFTTGAAEWLAAAPTAMWLLNQASTATAVDDVTGGGADQTAIDGTSVETGDDPDWDFSLAVETIVNDTPGGMRADGLAPVVQAGTTVEQTPGVTRGSGRPGTVRAGVAVADTPGGAQADGRPGDVAAGTAEAEQPGSGQAAAVSPALVTGTAVPDNQPGGSRAGGRVPGLETGATLAEQPGGVRAGGRVAQLTVGTTMVDVTGVARAAAVPPAIRAGRAVAERPGSAGVGGLPGRLVTSPVTAVDAPAGGARVGGRAPTISTTAGGGGVVVCVPAQPRIICVPAAARVITVPDQ